MIDYDKLKQQNKEINENIISDILDSKEKFEFISTDCEVTAKIAKYSSIYIDEIDEKFENATKLNRIDVTFLLFATALQCVRQYVIGAITQRKDDQSAAKNTTGHNEEHSNRKRRLYNPTIEEIISNPVPYDAIMGSKNFGLNIGGGFNHRAKTLGHDAILGWIFGTGNIATSTITLSENFQSYHVLTNEHLKRDMIAEHASTVKMLMCCKEKLFNQGIEGKKIMGVSVIKEAVHLKSDMYSTVSLPLPIISTISVEHAKLLADYGIDMGNVIKVGKQAAYAALINSLIGMIHGLLYDKSKYPNMDVYSVKTRKILSYSNLIASTSNVIAVAIAAIVGTATDNPALVKKSINFLDIGGIMVTIYRLVNDSKFICAVKEEFLKQQWYDLVINN